MEVRVMDHYGAQHEPQTFTGDPMQIEAQLRDYFKGVVGHIPFGSLHEMVRCLRGMTGIDIWVSEEPPRTPTKRRKPGPTMTDPWLHEVDLPLDNDDSNL